MVGLPLCEFVGALDGAEWPAGDAAAVSVTGVEAADVGESDCAVDAAVDGVS